MLLIVMNNPIQYIHYLKQQNCLWIFEIILIMRTQYYYDGPSYTFYVNF